MTKKDYQLIAEVIKKTSDQPYDGDRTICPTVMEDFANKLAGELLIDNPRFDRDRFLTACGF